MINTIFYFANNQAEYLDNWNRGEVKPHTICFAADTNTIWRNGERYSGMRRSEIDPIVDELEDRMNELDSQSKQALDNAVQRIENSLDQSVDQLNQTVDRVQQDLDNIIDDNRNEINQMINDVINGKGFIDGWQAGWDQNLNAYLIQVGILGQNGVDKGWSYLETKYNEIKAEVDAISVGTDTQVLQSLIDARIEGNSSIAELKARYALTNQDQVVLKWLSGGFYTEASANKSVSQVFASAEDVANHTQAISALQTKVNQLEDGDWSASIDLSSYVKKEDLDGEVSESISGLFTENSSNSAIADVFSRLKNTETETGKTTTAVSGLTSRVTNLEQNGAPVTESSLISGINVNKDEIVDILSQAGLVNTATLDSAEQSLGARITNAENTASGAASAVSGLTTRVESLEGGGYISESTLVSAIKNKADSIVSEAGLINTAKLNEATSGLIAADKLNDYTAEIIASVNNSGSNVLLNADKIKIDANHQLDLSALTITVDAENVNNLASKIDARAADVTVKSLSATNGTSSVIANSNGIIIKPTSSTTSVELKEDGSGKIASGAISWNPNGDITFGSKFITAANANLSVDSLEAGSSNKIYVDSSNGVYIDGICDSQIKPDGSGYLGNNAITWATDGSGSIANGLINWTSYGTRSTDFNIPNGAIQLGDSNAYLTVISKSNTTLSHGEHRARISVPTGVNGTAEVYLRSNSSSYRYTPTGPVDGDCDMRKKDVVEDENISIENIADAPLFKYTLKSNPEGPIKIGSSAQYWQNVIPEAVYSDDEGYLSLNYMTINTVASLTSAKEIVKLKEENTALKQRVEALEARLQLIENKLNAQ